MRKRKIAAQVKKPFGPWEKRPTQRRRHPTEVWLDHVYVNNRYVVQVSIVPEVLRHPDAWVGSFPIVHLWVRRNDGKMASSWNDLQRIKNELVEDGPERVAVQVFPTEANLVDQANMAHLWVYPTGYALPFGLEPAP